MALPTFGAGHHLIDFWTNMCLNHNLITEGELDTENFRSAHRHLPYSQHSRLARSTRCRGNHIHCWTHSCLWFQRFLSQDSGCAPLALCLVTLKAWAESTYWSFAILPVSFGFPAHRYQGPSPDEVALVEGARQLGFEFRGRTRTHATISFLGQEVSPCSNLSGRQSTRL